MLRSLGWRFWLKIKKFWLAAHAQPQEMLSDKTLRSGRLAGKKSEKPKATPESPQNCRRERIVVNMRPDVPSQESLGK